MARIILLGAGASLGSEDAVPTVPPGGDRLFDALEARGGVAASLPDVLKQKFRADFEEGMGAYFLETNGNVMRFQRELVHFLAEFRPGPRSAYIRLIRRVGIQRCLFVTLNYDLLIELSAAACGYGVWYGDGSNPAALRLLKLHGSCNFWPAIAAGSFRNVTMAHYGRAAIAAPVRITSREEALHLCATEDSLAPAIAMYAKGKRTVVCPDIVKGHQSIWKSEVAKASLICVSGVRVQQLDEHIWGPLASAKCPLFYYGFGAGDRTAYEGWLETTNRGNAFYEQADFSWAVNKICCAADYWMD